MGQRDGGLVELLKNANRTRRPEDSVALRVAILATVVTGALALAIVQAISVGTAIVVVAALCLAYFVSYKRRHSDNWAIKIALTVGAIFALIAFFGDLRTIATLDEVRFPLAHLFLWVQVLHGFDLPARKDLNFSLGSSLTLMAAAGSISQDLWYGIALASYFVLGVTALALAHRSEIADGTVATMRSPSRPSGGRMDDRPPGTTDLFKALMVTAVAGTLLFMVIPQPSGIRTFALPFSLGSGAGVVGSDGNITTPGFVEEGVPTSRASSSAYYGFNERMDLRVRGTLSDRVVMRIRSSAPAMWRGIVFDRYDGVAWEGDRSEPTRFEGDPPYGYPPEFRSLGPRSVVSQTFYIEAEQPNVVFAAGQPDSVWIEGDLGIDALGGLRTPSTLTEGTVYSVVSSRGSATPEELRALPNEAVPEALERFVELPATVPSRVEDLARRVTERAPTRYDKVKAIETWLARNYRYELDSPVPPPGQDAVDHFLFETDVGFCEQFASATAVMLRSIGIPARVVAGYATGTRNPFTGYWEIKNSDAHTWVEVWFPHYGWYEFDPTFAIPPAEAELSERVPLARLVAAIAEGLKGSFPRGGGELLRNGLFLLAAAVVTAGAIVAWRRLRPRHRGPPAPFAPAGPVARAFRRLETALAARGQGRKPGETAAELIKRATSYRRDEGAASALSAFEKERYAPRDPGEEEIRAAISELDRLAAEAERRESSPV